VERVREFEQSITKISSLDAPIGEKGEAQVIDLIEDESAELPSEHAALLMQHDRILAMLEHMSARERDILILRYGLKDGVARTLGETAKSFGITRERVRQIEQVAKRNLRQLLTTQEEQEGLLA